MEFEHQVEKQEGGGVVNLEHLKSALGSLNNLSEAGSIRICARTGHSEEEESSAWSLMSMVKGVTIVTSSEHSQTRMEICNGSKLTQVEYQLLKDVSGGLETGINPETSAEGFGGTYFMANAKGEKTAIFKPCDEEPFAPCNPKGFVGRALGDPGLKPTVPVGEAALREVAAYLLDHQSFAKIPTTLLTRTSHPAFNYLTEEASSPMDPKDLDLPAKLGSMQEFVSHFCDTTEMGTSKFTVSDVQRIAILDIRLYNTDRHAGNILVRKRASPASREFCQNLHSHQFGETGYELVPIDHGFCLPEALEPPYFEWQHWSQARMPLGDQEREYIGNIDIEADKALLRRELPVLREQSLRVMEISTTLLKRGVAAGLSLHEIAEIMTRPLVGMDKEKSELEKLCLEASDEIWMMSQAPTSDSEDSEGTYSTRLDELMFRMDDWRDSEYLNGSHSPFFGAEGTQLEDALEQLSLDGAGGSLEASQQHRTGLRSMSFALPTSSSCFQKRRTVIFAKQGQNHSNESPKEDRNRVVYPPLIQGSLPGSEDQVFRHLSEQQWPHFMDLLTQKIDEGLKNGKWMRCDLKKATSMSMNFGISCPRF